jgi:MFS family permease
MLLVACLAVFFSGPAQTYGVSVFVNPMIEELGWSRSLFSTVYSVGTLASAGVLVLVGRGIDRVGNRVIMAGAALLFGGALFLLSTVSGVLTLLLGFALLRTFGSGVLTLAARTLVPHWFHTRAGRAFSLISLAAMLSQAIVPSFNNILIESFGWRDAFRVNAFIMWGLLLPIVAIVIRNRPRDIGQFPDGVPPQDERTERSRDERGVTLHAALRSRTFWALIGASLVPSLVVTGLAFNQVAILTDRGLPSSLAATTFAVEAAVALPTTLAAGWLVDRYPVRVILMLGQVFLLIAMIFLLVAKSAEMVLLYSAWRGASSGLWMVAADVAWPSYFGRKHLGSIRGVGFAVGVVGAAIGPIPFGLSYDLLGSYTVAIAGLMALPTIAAVAVLQARPPKLK